MIVVYLWRVSIMVGSKNKRDITYTNKKGVHY